MTKEIGTLAELNVKPGDVVEWPGIGEYLVLDDGGVVSKVNGIPLKNGIDYPGKRFRIISRALDRPEPKIETVHLMNFHELAKGYAIVFTVKDGEPDCTSIKMEKLY